MAPKKKTKKPAAKKKPVRRTRGRRTTKAVASAPVAAKAASTQSRKSVLIVEDERPLAHALELKFQHEGFETVVAGNGEQALEAVQTGKFAAILLDLIMPGMDGFAFLEQNTSKAKVIVLSNLGQEEDRKRALELGAVEYFVKANTPIAHIVKRVEAAL